MGNKNYTNYSEKSKINVNENTDGFTVTNEEDGVHVRPVIDGEIIATPIEEIITPEVNEEENVKLVGIVTNCAKLNVRKEASKDSEVLCIINKNDKVDVLSPVSENLFVNIRTTSGVEGYCMEKYISIK